MKTVEDIKPFALLLEQEQKAGLVDKGYNPAFHRHAVNVRMGKKFARVDVGDSGKYMVDLESGEIYGIKGYGVVHRGHRYGTLDTIHEWDWRAYTAAERRAA